MGNREKLISYALKYKGEYNLIIKAIKENEEIIENSYANCITIFDEQYPSCLKELKNPPLVLFYKGDISLLQRDIYAVVGSRKACQYALISTKKLVESKSNKVLVSGLAKGVDGMAHLSCKTSIGVLGCGIDYIYPYENKELFKKLINEGLIISEYPGLVKPLSYHFPFRNRIIAALADEVYVMQSSEKSGTVTTINEALELQKEVKVLPYSLFEEDGQYNNQLINDGASIINIEDFS